MCFAKTALLNEICVVEAWKKERLPYFRGNKKAISARRWHLVKGWPASTPFPHQSFCSDVSANCCYSSAGVFLKDVKT